jgi:hypothetical protein
VPRGRVFHPASQPDSGWTLLAVKSHVGTLAEIAGRRQDNDWGQLSASDMPLEVHCAVQDSHDLKSGFVHSEENHMFPFRRNLAVPKEILAEPEF